MDFDPALLDEVAALTASLIRARPENPPGNEQRVVELLAPRLRDAGLEVEVAPFDPAGVDVAPVAGGRADGPRLNLKAVLLGRDPRLPPVLLLGHSDVAPADPTRWSSPPYEAARQGERLVGRGALDMLSMVALETLTLAALAQADVPRERDVILLVTGDAEGDSDGIRAALRTWPVLAKAAFALDEGGFLVESLVRPGEDVAVVGVAEKGLFQFRLEATGDGGEGHTPLSGAAPDRLVAAVARLLEREAPFRLTPESERQLRDLGAATGGLEGALLEHPALAAAVARPLVENSPGLGAPTRDTCALTILDAGIKRSVIPARATATFDCRLLPGTDPAAFHDRVLTAMNDPRVKLTVLQAAAATSSDPDHVVVQAIGARVRQELPRAAVVATLGRPATDCRFLRAARVPCYGFVPVRVTRDELDAIHGDDESVRVPELEKGLARLVDLTAFLANTPEAP